MLNHKFNACKSKSKSKIFITILCIFGLLFSYSCSCKNNVTGPGNDGLENGRDPNTINSSFTATPDAMNNHLDLYIQSDNNTNSVVIIKFKSEQNISAAKIIEVKHKSGTDVGLTKDELSYSLQNSELQLGDNNATRTKIASALTQEGETNTITLSVELTSDSANLNNTTTTVDVDVNLIKATKLGYDKIYSDVFQKIGIGGQIIINDALVFSFDKTKGASYNNDEISIKNSGDALDNTTITPTAFENKIKGESYFGKKSDVYSSATVSYNSISGNTATFYIDFVFSPKYEPINTKFKLDVDIVKDGKGKWDTTVS